MEKEYFVLYTPEKVETAYKYALTDFSHKQIIAALDTDDDLLKQICLINLESLYSHDEALKLVSVLTGQSGPVREVCACKIRQFLNTPETNRFFVGEKIRKTLLDGICDIIPSAAADISLSLYLLPEKNEILEELLDKTDEFLKNLQNVTNSHELNKKTFALYRALSALTRFCPLEPSPKLEKILEQSAKTDDYPVREKTAAVVVACKGFDDLKNLLKNDECFYVRRNF